MLLRNMMLLAFIVCSGSANAENRSSQHDPQAKFRQPKIEAKCFVEVEGGEQQLYYTRLPVSAYKSLERNLVGMMIPTNVANNQIMVTKVFECKKEGQRFKSGEARQIESSLAR
ncbi:TapY2 family type IVa secretion system protein [Thalassotalea maritima]|uniref:TapY2 family type IVa secretion system protein n=1 Tax=Thalassotalea maritima TaxID=3242416 RepID=UPI0035295855